MVNYYYYYYYYYYYWGQPSLLYNEYQVSFPGVKRPRRGVDHPSVNADPGGCAVKA